jgi:hypothetical protein
MDVDGFLAFALALALFPCFAPDVEVEAAVFARCFWYLPIWWASEAAVEDSLR